jgi:hypothetical protein
MQPISRRTFFAQAAALAGSYPLLGRRYASDAGPSVRVAVVRLPAARATQRGMGLTLGAEEATHAAALFGGKFELVDLQLAKPNFAGLSAVVGDEDCAQTLDLSQRASGAGIPFFNVGCTSDDLRGKSCQRTLFNVAPSDAMLRDAVSSSHVEGSAAAWNPSLSRFGADTLNHRFVARFGSPMTADAWTAWLSAKIIWESALRMSSANPGQLIEYLARDTTQFDGHKGLPLSFRSWDNQLRQPLYVVAGTRVVEVPVAASRDEASHELLDKLGTAQSASACHVHS